MRHNQRNRWPARGRHRRVAIEYVHRRSLLRRSTVSKGRWRAATPSGGPLPPPPPRLSLFAGPAADVPGSHRSIWTRTVKGRGGRGCRPRESHRVSPLSVSRPQAHADPGKATRPQPRDVGRALHGGTPRQGGAARACRASNWLTVGPTVLPLANGPRCAGKPVANTGWQNRPRPRPLSWPHRDWAPPAGRSRGYAAGSSGLEPRAPEAAQPLGAFV